ncbi:MAG: MAPEG family protein [Casimicrobiaceae bacterium]
MDTRIFWPVTAQVALVAIIAGRMLVTRLAELRSGRIDPQAVATSRSAAATYRDLRAADNFRNLFEVPVLFFAVCGALAITDSVTPLQLTLAWLYVGLRAIHSAIHVTYNRVLHRFAVFAASTVCVFVMWGAFAVTLWGRG